MQPRTKPRGPLGRCPATPPCPNPLDILLIEDSSAQALCFRLILEAEGYHVLVIADGAAGWRQVTITPPRLILLDIDLPSMDGFQVLSLLKRDRRTTRIPVVMLTHRDHIVSVEPAIALGADDYLFKDDVHYALCTTVEQQLQRVA